MQSASVTHKMSSNDSQHPKKKMKISLLALKSCASERKIRVGDLKQTATSQNPIVRGEISNVMLDCTVVDYMRGRKPARSGRDWTYVNVADSTGTIAFGLSEERSGLSSFRIPEDDMDEDSVCYFSARFRGTFSWIPKREDKSKYIMSLRGKVEGLNTSSNQIETMKSMVYPTTDVLEQIAEEESARFCRFVTPAFIGKIDDLVSGDSESTVLCSLSDPVGVAVLRITDVQSLEKFSSDYGIAENTCMIIQGELHISLKELENAKYACISLSAMSDSMKMTVIGENDFKAWEEALISIPERKFTGVIPQGHVSQES